MDIAEKHEQGTEYTHRVHTHLRIGNRHFFREGNDTTTAKLAAAKDALKTLKDLPTQNENLIEAENTHDKLRQTLPS